MASNSAGDSPDATTDSEAYAVRPSWPQTIMPVIVAGGDEASRLRSDITFSINAVATMLCLLGVVCTMCRWGCCSLRHMTRLVHARMAINRRCSWAGNAWHTRRLSCAATPTQRAGNWRRAARGATVIFIAWFVAAVALASYTGCEYDPLASQHVCSSKRADDCQWSLGSGKCTITRAKRAVPGLLSLDVGNIAAKTPLMPWEHHDDGLVSVADLGGVLLQEYRWFAVGCH